MQKEHLRLRERYSDDITFCTSESCKAHCERNAKHIQNESHRWVSTSDFSTCCLDYSETFYNLDKQISVNDVVQFNESHKWAGCLGIVSKVSQNKLLIGVVIPERGIAYIYAKDTEIELIGDAVLIFE